MTARDHQVGGDHYRTTWPQCWDVVDAFNLDFYEGNVLKYLLRRKPNTDRAEDLRKAMHYLEKCLERLEQSPPTTETRP